MAMIVQVGEKDEMLPVPPRFPRCGNYEPEVRISDMELRENSRGESSSDKLIAKTLISLVMSIAVMLLNL